MSYLPTSSVSFPSHVKLKLRISYSYHADAKGIDGNGADATDGEAGGAVTAGGGKVEDESKVTLFFLNLFLHFFFKCLISNYFECNKHVCRN